MTRPLDRIVYTDTWATFSEDGKYRHDLGRRWDKPSGGRYDSGLLVICGLNPSSAGADHDDPTIRRDARFAWDMGYGGLLKINIFDLVSTDPDGIARHATPCSLRNDEFIDKAMAGRDFIVCAWGAYGDGFKSRTARVEGLARIHRVSLYAFALTKGGAPRHTLYLPQTARPVPWRLFSEST